MRCAQKFHLLEKDSLQIAFIILEKSTSDFHFEMEEI